MNGHLRRCRCASGAHVRPSTLRSGSRGALHLTIPEQAPTPEYAADSCRVDTHPLAITPPSGVCLAQMEVDV